MKEEYQKAFKKLTLFFLSNPVPLNGPSYQKQKGPGSSNQSLFACGIFVDLQKAFDTVEHSILLRKFEHYSVKGLANDWFKSYLSDRKQFVSINGHNLNLTSVLYGVPQGSVLGPLLFLIYINDLNQFIKFCKVHHFVDDTNILYFSKSITKLNKYVNLDVYEKLNQGFFQTLCHVQLFLCSKLSL